MQQQAKVQSLTLSKRLEHIEEQRYIIILISVLIVFVLIFVIMQYHNMRKNHELAIRDPLSNLYNRRFIVDYLDKSLLNIGKKHGQLSLMLIDVDEFKIINDQYGHVKGDEVIKTIANIGLETFRGEDVMSRIGGDEFLCILPRVSEPQLVNIAQRLLKNIAAHVFKTEQDDVFSVSVSIGVSTIHEAGLTVEELLNKADKALYKAKALGKNQVCSSDQKTLNIE